MDTLTQLASSGGPVLYAVVAVIILFSSLPMVALVVAAEPFVLLAAMLVAHDRLSVGILLAVAAASSVVGDVLSYWLGRRFGPHLLKAQVVRKRRKRIVAAHRIVHRHGMLSVIVQRWMAPGRGFVPAAIGAAREPLALFVVYAAAAAVLWATVMVLGAYFGGGILMTALPIALTVVLIVQAVYRLVTRRRNRRNSAATTRG